MRACNKFINEVRKKYNKRAFIIQISAQCEWVKQDLGLDIDASMLQKLFQ